MFVLPIVVAVFCLCVLVLPGPVTLLCGLLVTLQVAGLGMRFWSARRDLRIPDQGRMSQRPVFTVHVATHNEPPALVTATLHALAAQDWPAADYEVIVIDNNTTDPALWQPVRDVCDGLGDRFRFLHRTGVVGAKAGALNIALSVARPDATHVVTVDADYSVGPRFLTQAAMALDLTGADYVQFPQAYSGCDGVADGIDAELAEYFQTSARMADVAEAVLLTGTLCVISVEALRAVDGWSGRTITEDADLGVRLCRMGFTGRFIGRIVGRGLLPFSLRDLERQRHRWASGNLQTLIAHAPALLAGQGGLGWRKRAAIVSQLTAWINLSLLPVVALLVGLATGRGGDALVLLAGASVWLTLIDIASRLMGQGRPVRTGPAIRAAAICHRIALAPVAACATLEAMIGRSLPFAVTDKSGTANRVGHVPATSLVLFTAAALLLPQALAQGWVVTGAVAALLLPLPAAWATARTLDRYRLRVTTSPTGV
ncbi:glycosyltransferase family 2 protein [Loktanella sp. DJP18]|uniref:glycosyltransferase family 2 protein n=1 Tax=Loktanella sp. DJP18 TaxID=3409788 RepID=UPI003BB53F9F